MAVSTESFDIGALTNVGRKRKDNQDSVLRAEDWGGPELRTQRETYGRLYLVADGVGGNEQGEVASRMAVDNVMDYFYNEEQLIDPVERLTSAIHRATADIYAESLRRQNNMATTLVAALIHNGKLIVANVGDSSAFLIRSGELPTKLTIDHVRAERDGSHSLSQAMGDPEVNIAFRTIDFTANDAVVLCTDGLTDLVKPEEIKRIVQANSASFATRELIRVANRYGGHDNITALVVRNGRLPLFGQRLFRQIVGTGLGAVALTMLLMWSIPHLLGGQAKMSGSTDNGGPSFSGTLIEVPVLNPTSGLVEMVQMTVTPTVAPVRPNPSPAISQPSPKPQLPQAPVKPPVRATAKPAPPVATPRPQRPTSAVPATPKPQAPAPKPPTPVPPTPIPPTVAPPTPEPPTPVPSTPIPPTVAPPTEVPPTVAPPTAEPPTAEPPKKDPPKKDPPKEDPPKEDPPKKER